MRMKSAKEKQGVARLFELAGQRKQKLILACTLSVLSSADRIVPFFTIYGVVRELLSHYQEPAMVDQNVLLMLCGVTFGAALAYGLCAFVSSALSHTAAYEIIYDLRLQLMEKLSRVSSVFLLAQLKEPSRKWFQMIPTKLRRFWHITYARLQPLSPRRSLPCCICSLWTGVWLL